MQKYVNPSTKEMSATTTKENAFIRLFFNRLTTRTVTRADVMTILKGFPKSVALQYYLGVYYDAPGDQHSINLAQRQFEKCIGLCPRFAAPVFHLAKYHMSNIIHVDGIDGMLLRLLNEPTLDATTGQFRHDQAEQFRACSMLASVSSLSSSQSSCTKTSKLHSVFTGFLDAFDRSPPNPVMYAHVEGYKNMCCKLATLHMDANHASDAALNYLRGLKLVNDIPMSREESATLQRIDKALMQGFMLVSDYCIDKRKLHSRLPVTPNAVYACCGSMPKELPWQHSHHDGQKATKVRIGYLSPDINKNAVALFITPLLKHFDASRFEVYVFYCNTGRDAYTTMFESLPHLLWIDISKMSDDTAFDVMRDMRLDVLVDLIGFGVGNRMELLAMRPVDIMINYLGYPSFTHMHAHTHRIVDNITDPMDPPRTSLGHVEKLIRLPRCFLCYHLFDNERLPAINEVTNRDKTLFIGITNRALKFHPLIMDAWRQIVTESASKRYSVRFLVKLEPGLGAERRMRALFEDFPADSVEFLPFADTLAEFLDMHNLFDFCLDTFPYSGTTTAASALLMGKPVFTVYDPKSNQHVSNTTASFMLNLSTTTDETFSKPFIASSIKDYIERVLRVCDDDEFVRGTLRNIEHQQERRRLFLEAHDPVRFMREYESAIDGLLLKK